MKKFLNTIYFFLLISVLSFAQEYKYAWLSDIHIGSPGADVDLENVVDDINTRPEIKFVILTGDIAEKGRNEELETTESILKKLKVPYHLIPGNHDTKWSESGCAKFAGLWGDDKFFFEYNGTAHIGINSGVYWRGGGGHVSVEDLNWLEEKLMSVKPGQEVVFYIHHPLDGDVDNWFNVTNMLRNYDITSVLHGHGHTNRIVNFNGIPAAMGRSTLSKNKSWGYNIVSSTKDSLLFYEINRENKSKLWGGIGKANDTIVPKIDSLQFINYDVNILWKEELNSSMSASLFPGKDKLFAATKDGILHCYSFDGKKLWSYDTHGTVFSRPVQNRDIVAVGTIEGDLITINVNTGEALQIIGITEPITSQLISYDLKNNDKLTAGVIVGTANGNLFCYDLYTLELIWENNSAQGMIETLPLYVKDKIIFGCWDNYLYCVDAKTGALNWKWTGNKNFYYSPAAHWTVTDGRNVYVSTPDKFVSAVDLLQGTTVWRKNDFASWESIGIDSQGKNLLIKSLTDKFYIVDAKTGKLIKEVNAKFGLDTMPNQPVEDKGNIFWGSKNGSVYLIDKKYNWKPLLFTGTSRVHSVYHLKDNLYAASNMDGGIYVFSLK